MTYSPPPNGDGQRQQPVTSVQAHGYPQQYGYPRDHGYPQQYPAAGYAVPRPTNSLAIITLVLALVSVSIGAVITGHISLGQIARTGEQGRGMALAGLIIGYVGCGFWILFWLGMLILPALWAMMITATMGTAAV